MMLIAVVLVLAAVIAVIALCSSGETPLEHQASAQVEAVIGEQVAYRNGNNLIEDLDRTLRSID